MLTFKLNFYTQYSQFYICDKNSTLNTGSVEFWTEKANADRLAIELGILGIATECYGQINCEVLLLDNENFELDLKLYDHVVEAGLSIDSGVIQVLACGSSSVELEINLEPGIYRFRVYSSNLASYDGDNGDDFYKIEVWRSSFIDKKVLKRYL